MFNSGSRESHERYLNNLSFCLRKGIQRVQYAGQTTVTGKYAVSQEPRLSTSVGNLLVWYSPQTTTCY